MYLCLFFICFWRPRVYQNFIHSFAAVCSAKLSFLLNDFSAMYTLVNMLLLAREKISLLVEGRNFTLKKVASGLNAFASICNWISSEN